MSSIQKIIRIDQSDYIKDIKLKLSKLINERNAIDVDLDESEMMELLNVLKKIICVESKKGTRYEALDHLISAEIKPLVETRAQQYFEKKFYAQESKGTLEEVRQVALKGIQMSPSCVYRTTIKFDSFFPSNANVKIFSNYCPKNKELFIVDLSDLTSPVYLPVSSI